MIDIEKTYLRNSKMELINELDRQGKLIEVLQRFFKEMYWASNIKRITIHSKHGSCINVFVEASYRWHNTNKSYSITDYSCWDLSDEKDFTDKLIKFFSARLQGETRAKYLVGLGEFSKKTATDIENQLLNAGQVETVEDVIDLQPEKRLIEQQIEQNESIIDEKVDVVIKANMKHYNALVGKDKTTAIEAK